MGLLISKFNRLSINDVRIETEKNLDIYPDEANLKTPKEKFIADQILDPRSATMGIKRTPLVLVKVAGETPVRRKYLETDLDERSITDNSFQLEVEESDVSNQSVSLEEGQEVFLSDDIAVNNKDEEDPMEEEDKFDINCDYVDSPLKDKGRKTFIYEDDVLPTESTPVKPKNGRTPLSVVSTNSPLPSPLGKPWRGIREERLRLGLENTPPNQEPFRDAIQSAPGKFGFKKSAKKSWTRTHWAPDESVVI